MGCGGSTPAQPAQQQKKPETKAEEPKKEEAPKEQVEQQEKPETKAEEPKKEEAPKEQVDQEAESPAEPQQEPTSTGEYTEFERYALKMHNEYRALHGCSVLTLNRDICNIAQKWADHLAATQSFEHSADRKYNGQSLGENLYMSMNSAPTPDGDGATKSWYDEIKDYSWEKPGFAMNTGHFTQVVWKGTSELGIASATYKKDDWYTMVVVANYCEAGNMMGDFEASVPALL